MKQEIFFETTRERRGLYILSFGGNSSKGESRDLNNDSLWCGSNLIVVADGIGKREEAGYASRTAVEIMKIAGTEKRGIEYAQRLDEVMKTANSAVYERAQARGNPMGTTCTALRWYEEGENIAWELAHVGDSAAYRANLKKVNCRKLTIDHVIGTKLTRGVGCSVDLEVDYQRGIIEEEDMFILCSDGLRKGMSEEDIIGSIAEIIHKKKDPGNAAKKTNEFAHLLNDCDNCTTAVLYVQAAQRG